MTALWALAFPRQVGGRDTRPQAFLRDTRTGHPATDIGLEFGGIVRGRAGGGLAHLRPHEFHRIEFRRTSWKPMHIKTRMPRQKLGNQFAFMNRMLVPDHNDRAAHMAEQMLQKQNDLRTRHGTPMRLQV